MSFFSRSIITDYYDGPIEGFTECSECRQTYSFRKLDWDELQDVRIFAFSPIDVNLDAIASRLALRMSKVGFQVVPPLEETNERFVKELFAKLPTWIAAIEGWPGQSSAWCKISEHDLENVDDWFSFLGIKKRKQTASQ